MIHRSRKILLEFSPICTGQCQSTHPSARKGPELPPVGVATWVATRDASRVARSPANEKEEPEVKEYGSRQGTSVGRLLQFPDLIALLNTFLVIMC